MILTKLALSYLKLKCNDHTQKRNAENSIFYTSTVKKQTHHRKNPHDVSVLVFNEA